jgi:hypothetical protein
MLKPGSITYFELTRFSVPGDQHADETCSAQHSQNGVNTKGVAATHMFELWEKSWY